MNNFSLQAKKIINAWARFKPIGSVRFLSDNLNIEDFLNEEEGSPKIERCVNEVRLLGRVGADPVLINSDDGKNYAKFKVATSVPRSTGEPKTDWHNIVTFNPKLINYVANYVKKGQRLYLSGSIHYFVPENSSSSSVKHAFISLNNIISVSK